MEQAQTRASTDLGYCGLMLPADPTSPSLPALLLHFLFSMILRVELSPSGTTVIFPQAWSDVRTSWTLPGDLCSLENGYN